MVGETETADAARNTICPVEIAAETRLGLDAAAGIEALLVTGAAILFGLVAAAARAAASERTAVACDGLVVAAGMADAAAIVATTGPGDVVVAVIDADALGAALASVGLEQDAVIACVADSWAVSSDTDDVFATITPDTGGAAGIDSRIGPCGCVRPKRAIYQRAARDMADEITNTRPGDAGTAALNVAITRATAVMLLPVKA